MPLSDFPFVMRFAFLRKANLRMATIYARNGTSTGEVVIESSCR